MAAWVRAKPKDSFQVCEDHIRLEAGSAEAALVIMRLGASKVSEGIEKLIIAALPSTPDLIDKILKMVRPRISYTVGEPREHIPGKWEIPFVAYASDLGEANS